MCCCLQLLCGVERHRVLVCGRVPLLHRHHQPWREHQTPPRHPGRGHGRAPVLSRWRLRSHRDHCPGRQLPRALEQGLRRVQRLLQPHDGCPHPVADRVVLFPVSDRAQHDEAAQELEIDDPSCRWCQVCQALQLLGFSVLGGWSEVKTSRYMGVTERVNVVVRFVCLCYCTKLGGHPFSVLLFLYAIYCITANVLSGGLIPISYDGSCLAANFFINPHHMEMDTKTSLVQLRWPTVNQDPSRLLDAGKCFQKTRIVSITLSSCLDPKPSSSKIMPLVLWWLHRAHACRRVPVRRNPSINADYRTR